MTDTQQVLGVNHYHLVEFIFAITWLTGPLLYWRTSAEIGNRIGIDLSQNWYQYVSLHVYVCSGLKDTCIKETLLLHKFS